MFDPGGGLSFSDQDQTSVNQNTKTGDYNDGKTDNSSVYKIMNFGEMVQPYNQGSTQNGGLPINFQSRYLPEIKPSIQSIPAIQSQQEAEKTKQSYLLILAGLGIVAAIIVLKRRVR